MPITYHVVVPFGRDADGNLVPLEPAEAPNAETAKRRAQRAAETSAGAVAFSRTGDPNTGEFSDPVLLATYGEVDKGMLGE
jgi:hypothetical protein